MKKLMLLLLAAMLVLTMAGCGKKTEETGKVPSGTGSVANMPPGMGEGMPPAGMGEGMPPAGMGEGMPPGMGQRMAAAPKQLVVPDSVKKTWVAAKVLVAKKGSNDQGKVYEIAADKSVTVPGTNLRVEVGQYLPDFQMDGQSITSKSDDAVNPTVRMTVFEGDKEIYKGWAFEKYPEAHAFTHPDYSITLVGGVKAK